MPTLKEWDEAIEAMSPEERKKMKECLEGLESIEFFKEAFKWTGMFALTYSITHIQQKNKEQ